MIIYVQFFICFVCIFPENKIKYLNIQYLYYYLLILVEGYVFSHRVVNINFYYYVITWSLFWNFQLKFNIIYLKQLSHNYWTYNITWKLLLLVKKTDKFFYISGYVVIALTAVFGFIVHQNIIMSSQHVRKGQSQSATVKV